MRVRSFEELEKDVGKLTEFRAPPPPPRHRGGLLSFFLPSAAAEDASAGYSSSSDDDGTDASSSLPAAAEKSPQNPPLPPPLPPPPRDRYWMRDSLYAACADCGQPFTAWTRRVRAVVLFFLFQKKFKNLCPFPASLPLLWSCVLRKVLP